MAKLKAPLLSLGASGQIARTLVMGSWKGLKVAREYVVPANPNTTAQAAQRSTFAAAVAAWRTYLTNAAIVTGWNTYAGTLSGPQSGFNAAMGALCKVLADDDDASFVTEMASSVADLIEVTLENMDDGATGDESGDFILQEGTTKSNLADTASTGTISGGSIEFDADISDGSTKYYQVFKVLDGTRVPRSGIVAVTCTVL